MYALSKRSQFPLQGIGRENTGQTYIYINSLLLSHVNHGIILPEGWYHPPFVRRKRMPRQGDGRLRTGTR